MSVIETYSNIKLPSVKKKQLEKIIFNTKLVFERKISEIEMYDYVFVVVTQYIYEQSDKIPSTKIYGRVTDIRERAIQLNYTLWLPKSQINKMYVKKPLKQTTLLMFYEE